MIHLKHIIIKRHFVRSSDRHRRIVSIIPGPDLLAQMLHEFTRAANSLTVGIGQHRGDRAGFGSFAWLGCSGFFRDFIGGELVLDLGILY